MNNLTPAQLALGGERLYSDHRAPVVSATVMSHEQDRLSGVWTMTVNLRGGRTKVGVQPLHTSDGAMSGSRRPLPSRGTRGLVLFAEAESSGEAFWLGTYDAHTYGVDRATSSEDLDLHPSGTASATTADGTRTTRFANGDTFWGGLGLPYLFELRKPGGQGEKAALPTRAGMNRYVFEAPAGVLFQARLFGGMTLKADAVKRQILLALDDDDQLKIEDGVMTARTRLLQVGRDPANTVPVALWPEVEANLKALAGELQQVKARLVQQEAYVRQLRMRWDMMMKVVAPVLFPWFIPVSLAIIKVPLPFITKSGKDGALLASVGGVQVVNGASRSMYGE